MEDLNAYEERSSFFLSPSNLSRIIRNRRKGWRSDHLSFVPLLDHGPGTLSLSPDVDPETTDVLLALRRIELNQRNGRPLDEGIPDDIQEKYFGGSKGTDREPEQLA